jgi:hypothetical protein
LGERHNGFSEMDGEHLYVNSACCCWLLVVHRPESVIPGLPSIFVFCADFERAGRFAHVEKAYANWVCPSLSCLLAMLRSRGCDINRTRRLHNLRKRATVELPSYQLCLLASAAGVVAARTRQPLGLGSQPSRANLVEDRFVRDRRASNG